DRGVPRMVVGRIFQDYPGDLRVGHNGGVECGHRQRSLAPHVYAIGVHTGLRGDRLHRREYIVDPNRSPGVAYQFSKTVECIVVPIPAWPRRASDPSYLDTK